MQLYMLVLGWAGYSLYGVYFLECACVYITVSYLFVCVDC